MSVVSSNREALKALRKARDLMDRARNNEARAARRSIPDCFSAEKDRQRAYQQMDKADALFSAVETYLRDAEDDEDEAILEEYAE